MTALMAKDGMDIALCSINIETNDMHFAGAYNPLFLVRKGKVIAFKGDRMPVGVHDYDDLPFTNYRYKLREGDNIYLFSDGYVDQFGGPKNKKLKYKHFKNILVEASNLKSADQRALLEHTFYSWKADNPQLDDILIVGVTI